MYVSLKWLQDLIWLNKINFPNFCEKLTLAGFEIDDTIQKQTLNEIDYILDINITANRGDIFNINGIIREIISLTGKNLLKINKNLSEFASWQYFIQKNYFFSKNFTSCPKSSYCSLLFTVNTNKILIKESPDWIKKKLFSSGFVPTNNIIDIANLILLETGYSFVLYDKFKLQRFVKNEELNFTSKLSIPTNKFLILNNEKNLLNKKFLLSFVNEIPVDIIGLSQLQEISVTQNTNEIIIQAGLFNNNQIRKSSSQLGLKTELSKRLEKELNPNGLERAFIRLLYLLFTQNIKCKIFFDPISFQFDLSQEVKKKIPFNKKKILLSYNSINQILGNLSSFKKINKQKIFSSLNNLNLKILKTNKLNCLIEVPYSRGQDIIKEIDLVEEIGRILGFNNFLSTIPFFQGFGKFSKLEKLKKRLRNYFLSIGLNEVLNYTLVSNQNNLSFIPKLKNPLLSESTSLRSTSLENLLEKLKFNKNQGNFLLEGFEINRIYKYNEKYNLIEQETLTGVFGNQNIFNNLSLSKTSLNWFEAKGLLEEILYELNLNLIWSYDKKNISSLFSSKKLAHLFSGDNFCGSFGQIHPGYAQKLNIPQTIYLFELNLGCLEKIWTPKTFFSYFSYSLYPKSIVDISIILPNNVSFQSIKTCIYKLNDTYLKNIYLFDFYSNYPIPKGYNSFGLKLQFQSNERTLTNLEIEKEIKNIKLQLTKTFDIIFRY